MHYPYCFTIDKLRFSSHLGWSEQERRVRQPVDVYLRLYFKEKPACMQDDNAQFLDYHGLCKALEAQVEDREFRLIEYMASELFNAARAYIMDGAGCKETALSLHLIKSRAPVEHLEGGAGFALSDLPEGATTITPH